MKIHLIEELDYVIDLKEKFRKYTGIILSEIISFNYCVPMLSIPNLLTHN